MEKIEVGMSDIKRIDSTQNKGLPNGLGNGHMIIDGSDDDIDEDNDEDDDDLAVDDSDDEDQRSYADRAEDDEDEDGWNEGGDALP